MSRWEDRGGDEGPGDKRDILATICRYFDEGPAVGEMIDPELPKGHQFLAWLWMRGFKVAPVTEDDLETRQ